MKNIFLNKRPAQNGFTILEVLLALAICGIALVSLFGIIAGSKHLAFKSQNAIKISYQQRNLVSMSMLVDESGELLIPAQSADLQIELLFEKMEEPERKTTTTTETLYQYDIKDDDDIIVLSGTYWVTLEQAE